MDFHNLSIHAAFSLSLSLQASYGTEYVRMNFDFTIGLCVTLSVLAVGVAVYAGFRVNGFLRRSGQLCCHIHVCLRPPSMHGHHIIAQKFEEEYSKFVFSQENFVLAYIHMLTDCLSLSPLFRHLFSCWLSLVLVYQLLYLSYSLLPPHFGSSSTR